MAKLAPVKCLYCGQQFEREHTEFVTVGRRYAHQTCADKRKEQEQTIEDIHSYIKSVLGETYQKTRVTSQIKQLLDEGKTAEGILKTLHYWYDIKKSDPSKAFGGIGIVQYVYAEALEYYHKETVMKNLNKDIDVEKFLHPEVVEINISPQFIRKPKRVNLFTLD